MMTSPMGRGGRVVIGLGTLTLGQFVVGGTMGTVMSIMSLVPVSGGIFDFCLIAKALGFPLSGVAARSQLMAGEFRESKRSRA